MVKHWKYALVIVLTFLVGSAVVAVASGVPPKSAFITAKACVRHNGEVKTTVTWQNTLALTPPRVVARVKVTYYTGPSGTVAGVSRTDYQNPPTAPFFADVGIGPETGRAVFVFTPTPNEPVTSLVWAVGMWIPEQRGVSEPEERIGDGPGATSPLARC